MLPDPHFKIEEDEHGNTLATDGNTEVMVQIPVKVFNRNAKKFAVGGDGFVEHHRMLVVDAGGVKIYVRGNKIIVTDEDLYL